MRTHPELKPTTSSFNNGTKADAGKPLTSAYGLLSSIDSTLVAFANCATLEESPTFPQSYCWTVGVIVKTGGCEDMVKVDEVSERRLRHNLSEP